MKKKIILVVFLLLACAIAVFWWLRESPFEDPSTLRLYGNVDIREVTLGFRVSGRVEQLLAEEGDRVEKGQLIARLDDLPYQQQLEEAQAVLSAREAAWSRLQNGFRKEEVRKAQATVEAAEVRVDIAKRNLQRQMELDENEAGTKQILDETRAARDQAVADLEVARAGLELLQAGYREESIEQAQAEVRSSRARVSQMETAVQDCSLHAPSAGIVRSRIVEPGAIVSAGTPVYVLSVTERPWVRAYVTEPNLGNIKPGMTVQVFTDSRPEQPYTGTVGFISPTAEFTPKTVQTEALRSDLVYRFRIVVQNPDEQLRQGMPVTVVL